MKKTSAFLTVISFVTVAFSNPSDLKLSCDVEPAWIPQAGSCEYLTPKDIRWCATKNAFCITVRPAFEWKFLYGWFDFAAFSAAPKNGTSFAPFRMSYSNEIGVQHQFSSVKISSGWLHNCQHRVAIANYNDWQNHYNDSGYDLVFLRFHFHN